MKQPRPLIYFGCALTNAPKQFLQDIDYIREAIAPHGEMLRFLGLKHPSVSDAYQWDINCVRRCDVMVADLTHPSLGLGMELGVAVENRKPLILLANDALASPRLLMWGSWDPRHFKLRYQTRQEATEFAIAQIRQLFPGS